MGSVVAALIPKWDCIRGLPRFLHSCTAPLLFGSYVCSLPERLDTSSTSEVQHHCTLGAIV
jgi:hypothetical protein